MNELIYIKEPTILFAHSQKMEDPRDGLTLFGPLEENKPYGILNGVVGTKDGLIKFKEFIKSIQSPIYNKNNFTRPFFPGFEAAFQCQWDVERLIFKEITSFEVNQLVYSEDVHERTFKLVNLYVNKIIEATKNEDIKPDIWFVIIPDEIYKFCRPKSTVPSKLVTIKRTVRKSLAKKYIEAPTLFDEINKQVEPFKYDPHFHNQLKARLLKHKITTQIIRESTLDWRSYVNKFGKPIRDFSRIEGHLAWCLSTAAYFKAGGKPWKLSNIRKGVCYVGLVYKQDQQSKDIRNACCAAQMFLDSGDGIVFRGAVGPWYNKKTKEYHLKKPQAKELMTIAVETFKEKHREYPQELFIHAKTHFNIEEWKGFSEAVPRETSLIGISISETKPLKMYRMNSKYPILRGLAYVINDKSAYLWTKGFVPRLGTSLTMEVPNPLYIEVSKGKTDIKTVLTDILALTKLNYNTCIYGDGIPVTLRFADSIGEILTAGPHEKTPPLAFKYYI